MNYSFFMFELSEAEAQLLLSEINEGKHPNIRQIEDFETLFTFKEFHPLKTSGDYSMTDLAYRFPSMIYKQI